MSAPLSFRKRARSRKRVWQLAPRVSASIDVVASFFCLGMGSAYISTETLAATGMCDPRTLAPVANLRRSTPGWQL